MFVVVLEWKFPEIYLAQILDMFNNKYIIHSMGRALDDSRLGHCRSALRT